MTKTDFDKLVRITDKINNFQKEGVGSSIIFLSEINDELIKFLTLKLKEGLEHGQNKRFSTRTKSAGSVSPKDSTGTV